LSQRETRGSRKELEKKEKKNKEEIEGKSKQKKKPHCSGERMVALGGMHPSRQLTNTHSRLKIIAETAPMNQ
jgi:hypothetical protein